MTRNITTGENSKAALPSLSQPKGTGSQDKDVLSKSNKIYMVTFLVKSLLHRTWSIGALYGKIKKGIQNAVLEEFHEGWVWERRAAAEDNSVPSSGTCCVCAVQLWLEPPEVSLRCRHVQGDIPFLEPKAIDKFSLFSTWTGMKKKSLGLAGFFLVSLGHRAWWPPWPCNWAWSHSAGFFETPGKGTAHSALESCTPLPQGAAWQNVNLFVLNPGKKKYKKNKSRNK